jgi:hypothetical protein
VPKRIQWEDLDAALIDAISARTGPILAGRAVTAGQNSPLAAALETRNGMVFVKGLPSDHRMVITQAREAATAPLVRDISPQLLWKFDEAGWNVLGYEYLDGRPANYQPGSPDIDLVVGIMQKLSAIEVPVGPGPWKPIETRLRTYLDDPADAAMFTGCGLTHTDWMPDNIIVAQGRAWLIDWAWATPAQSWIDPASWLIKLLAHGHTVTAAEAIAAQLPAYAAADPVHIAAFARANRNLWDEIETGSPIPWTVTMAAAARTWAQHRAVHARSAEGAGTSCPRC